MFLKIKDSSDANKNIRWIVNTEGIKMWGIHGFTANGYWVRSGGTINTDSHMNFRWNESGISFESYDDLERAKLACFEEMGYKHVTVSDMKHGDVFSVMHNNIETKCHKFKLDGCHYVLVMDGQLAGKLNPGFVNDNTLVHKQYKLTEVQK